MASDHKLSVIVVGAGPVGLLCALDLKKLSEVNVSVYEARDRIATRKRAVYIRDETQVLINKITDSAKSIYPICTHKEQFQMALIGTVENQLRDRAANVGIPINYQHRLAACKLEGGVFYLLFDRKNDDGSQTRLAPVTADVVLLCTGAKQVPNGLFEPYVSGASCIGAGIVGTFELAAERRGKVEWDEPQKRCSERNNLSTAGIFKWNEDASAKLPDLRTVAATHQISLVNRSEDWWTVAFAFFSVKQGEKYVETKYVTYLLDEHKKMHEVKASAASAAAGGTSETKTAADAASGNEWHMPVNGEKKKVDAALALPSLLRKYFLDLVGDWCPADGLDDSTITPISVDYLPHPVIRKGKSLIVAHGDAARTPNFATESGVNIAILWIPRIVDCCKWICRDQREYAFNDLCKEMNECTKDLLTRHGNFCHFEKPVN